MKRNIKLVLEYDGTDFVGWQRQPNGRSVQQVIEESILQLTQEKVSLVGAGRTDSGVHARGQVANFFTDANLSTNDFYRALNGILPEDIVIHSVEEVDERFSARYSAQAREYCYVIMQKPTAIERRFCWQVGYHLNFSLLNETAQLILGEHDFQSFSKTDTEVQHFRCTVFESYWERKDAKLVFTVRANRFLYGMVRALVGTMVNVARGYTSFDEFKKILVAKDRAKAGQSAPPRGLFLERVIY